MSNRLAAALSYNASFNAPKVVAQGKSKLAEDIINKAKQYDIPIFQNEALALSLIEVDVGMEIPSKLYDGIVEVFLWLDDIQSKTQLSKTTT